MKKNKIMLIDDDREFLEELKEMLTLSNYDVVAVNDSTSVLNAVDIAKPDLIMLDLKMDGLNGFQVIERLEKSKEMRKIPIIIMTGYLNNDVYSTLVDIYKIDMCIKKPFNPLDVISQIEMVLNKRLG